MTTATTTRARPIFRSVAIILGTLVLIALFLGWYLQTRDALESQRQDSQQKHVALVELRQQNERLQKSNAKIFGQYANVFDELKKLGVTPKAPTPSEVQSAAGLPTSTSSSGPSIDIVTCDANGAWHEHFSNGTTQIVQGPCVAQNGKDGANATDTQIAAAVAAFCAASADCKGPPGSDGAVGATGSAGGPGANGATGTSVTGIACVALTDGSSAFEFTLTAADGSTSVQDIPGPCIPPAPPTEGDTPNE